MKLNNSQIKPDCIADGPLYCAAALKNYATVQKKK